MNLEIHAARAIGFSLYRGILNPERILKSGDRMIVFWCDGTKTVVKRAEDEPDNDYAAYTAALAKKIYGSNNAVKRIVASAETQKKGRDKNETARREDGQNDTEGIYPDR